MTFDEQIAAAYQSGATYRDIQREYHLQACDVRAALREQGVVPRKRGGAYKANGTIHAGSIKTNAPIIRRQCTKGQCRPCVLSDDDCVSCIAEHSIDSFCGIRTSSAHECERVGAGR